MELASRGWTEATGSTCCYLTTHDTCDVCKIPMEQATEYPMLVCPMCQSTRMTLTQYGKQDDSFQSSKYIRKGHFRLYMMQVQYLEQNRVAPEDVWKVANFLAAHGFTAESCSVSDVRWALFELKMNRCYNFVTQIYCRVTNKPPPRFTPAQKGILLRMFDAI